MFYLTYEELKQIRFSNVLIELQLFYLTYEEWSYVQGAALYAAIPKIHVQSQKEIGVPRKTERQIFFIYFRKNAREVSIQ